MGIGIVEAISNVGAIDAGRDGDIVAVDGNLSVSNRNTDAVQHIDSLVLCAFGIRLSLTQQSVCLGNQSVSSVASSKSLVNIRSGNSVGNALGVQVILSAGNLCIIGSKCAGSEHTSHSGAGNESGQFLHFHYAHLLSSYLNIGMYIL